MLLSSIKHFMRYHKATLPCTDNVLAPQHEAKHSVNPPHCFYGLVIGSATEYHHQMRPGVPLSALIPFGCGLYADCLGTEGMATAPSCPCSHQHGAGGRLWGQRELEGCRRTVGQGGGGAEVQLARYSRFYQDTGGKGNWEVKMLTSAWESVCLKHSTEVRNSNLRDWNVEMPKAGTGQLQHRFGDMRTCGDKPKNTFGLYICFTNSDTWKQIVWILCNRSNYWRSTRL